MCSCPNSTCAEIALFIFGLISFIVSIPGIFYSAIFWLFTGPFVGLTFIVMFCCLLATGILETFHGSGCSQSADCRKCTLKAAIAIRAVVLAALIFTLVFFTKWEQGVVLEAFFEPFGSNSAYVYMVIIILMPLGLDIVVLRHYLRQLASAPPSQPDSMGVPVSGGVLQMQPPMGTVSEEAAVVVEQPHGPPQVGVRTGIGTSPGASAT